MSTLSFSDVKIAAPDGRLLLAIDELSVGPGLHALTGGNGAGKSTLLKSIMGLNRASSGSIELDGLDNRRDRQAFLSRAIYQPQNFVAYPDLTALEFLVYFARLRGVDKKAAKQRAESLLELVGLSQAANQRTDHFSQGMLQRLGLAYALQSGCSVVILDEPFAGVDPDAREVLLKLIVERAQQAIVLVCTHYITEFMAQGATRLNIAHGTLTKIPAAHLE